MSGPLPGPTPHALFWHAWRVSLADAPRARRWKARVLRLDPAPLHNGIALSGMAPIAWDGGWRLGVALPQPCPARLLDPIDDVLLIDPRAGTAELMRDAHASHVAPAPAPRVAILSDPRAWARDVALHRLEWFRGHQHARSPRDWTGTPRTALLLGAPSEVHWADFRARVLEVPAKLRAEVRRAMLAQARLPRIEVAQGQFPFPYGPSPSGEGLGWGLSGGDALGETSTPSLNGTGLACHPR